MSKRHGKRIYVPTRSIQGGLDFKFESDPYDVELHGLMTPEQYTEAIDNLNEKLRPSRSGKADGVLLATGPLLVPLAIWSVRHRNQTKRRKRLLKDGIHEFNMQYQELSMRWNRRPESTLTIERRHVGNASDSDTPHQGQSGEEELAMVHATLLSDVVAPASVIPATGGSSNGAQQQPRPTRSIQSSNRASEATSSGLV